MTAAVVVLATGASRAQEEKPAYAIYDKEGKTVTYGEMVRELAKPDVVFLGEIHNCPVTHWLEFEIARSLQEIHGPRLTIGEEMLESDVQLIVDEFLQGKIAENRFEAEARRQWAVEVSGSDARVAFERLGGTHTGALHAAMIEAMSLEGSTLMVGLLTKAAASASRSSLAVADLFEAVHGLVALARGDGGYDTMTLWIDVDRNPKTGWYGYDYRVNYGSELQQYENGVWRTISDVASETEGDRMFVTIPRSVLQGISADPDIEFKWSDNMQQADPMDWYVNGDAAPGGRFNYIYKTK